MEIIEVGVVGLAKVLELPVALPSEDRGRATTKVVVVDARDDNFVVAEFEFDFRRSYEGGREFGFFRYVRVVVVVVFVDGGGRHWDLGLRNDFLRRTF